MNRGWTCLWAVSRVILTLAILFSYGCTERSDNLTQIESPSSNNVIIDDAIVGDLDSRTAIWDLLEYGGNLYFLGRLNGDCAVGHLETDGTIVWHRTLNMYVSDIDFVDIPGESDNPYLLVTGKDLVGGEGYQRGHFSIIDRSGTVLAEKTIGSDYENDIWVSAAQPVSDGGIINMIMFSGGARLEGECYPYCNYYHIEGIETIESIRDTIFSGYPGDLFSSRCCKWNMDEVDPHFFLNLATDSESNTHVSICCIDDHLNICWEQNALPDNVDEGHIFEIEYSDGTLFVPGYVREKKNSGNNWYSCFLASLSSNGAVLWSRKYSFSEFGDDYYACALVYDQVYAVGAYSNFTQYVNERTYGYGLVSIIDPLTGELLSSGTMGDGDYRSIMNDFVVIGNDMIVGGWTNQYLSGSFFQGWLVSIDAGDLDSELILPEPDFDGTSRLIPSNEIYGDGARK